MGGSHDYTRLSTLNQPDTTKKVSLVVAPWFRPSITQLHLDLGKSSPLHGKVFPRDLGAVNRSRPADAWQMVSQNKSLKSGASHINLHSWYLYDPLNPGVGMSC
jgi:hypothetical protein